MICPICNFTGTYEEVEQHMKEEHADTHHICVECTQCFSMKKMLNMHMQYHKDKKEEYGQCGKKFSLKVELRSTSKQYMRRLSSVRSRTVARPTATSKI